MNKLFGFMDLKEKRQFLQSSIISLLTILSGAALFGLSAFLIAFCGMRPFISDIMVAVVGVRFFGILRAVLRYIERLVTHGSTFRIIGKIRALLLMGLNEKNEEDLEQLNKADTLIKLVDDTERLQDFYLRTFQPLITGILCGVLGVALFSAFLSTNGAIVFGIAYFGGLLAWPILSMVTTKKEIMNLIKNQISEKELLLEYFSNYMDISCNSAEMRWQSRLNEEWISIEKSESKIGLVSSLTNGFNILFVNGSIAAVLYMSWRLIGNQGIESLLIPVFALIIPALFEGTAPLASFYEKYLKSDLAAERVFSLMKPELEMPIPDSEDTANGNAGSVHGIQMKDISFCPNGKTVLENIHMHLKPGEKIAVVGPSGSGKTTLGKLLIGAIKPTEGEVILPGNRERLFSVVNQQVFLFNTSIRNNLLIGNNKASEEELEEALSIVEMLEFCHQLPEGISTEIGENGMRLSGGQRQRIAIARALLKNAPYLVLDEGTSGLDIRSEKDIIKRILERYKDKGILVITHRLVKMEDYDEIIVLKNGKIRERGTHIELEKSGGWYHKAQNMIKNHLN